MKKLISFNTATKISLLLFALMMLFHIAVIIGMVFFEWAPMEFLWGGRMATSEELLGFEFISLITTLLCVMVVLIRTERLRMPGLIGASRVMLWILFVLFVLNTLGNLVAQSTFERSAAMVTALLAVMCLRMALEPVRKAG